MIIFTNCIFPQDTIFVEREKVLICNRTFDSLYSIFLEDKTTDSIIKNNKYSKYRPVVHAYMYNDSEFQSTITFTLSPYFYKKEGFGDWVCCYIVDIITSKSEYESLRYPTYYMSCPDGIIVGNFELLLVFHFNNTSIFKGIGQNQKTKYFSSRNSEKYIEISRPVLDSNKTDYYYSQSYMLDSHNFGNSK